MTQITKTQTIETLGYLLASTCSDINIRNDAELLTSEFWDEKIPHMEDDLADYAEIRCDVLAFNLMDWLFDGDNDSLKELNDWLTKIAPKLFPRIAGSFISDLTARVNCHCDDDEETYKAEGGFSGFRKSLNLIYNSAN